MASGLTRTELIALVEQISTPGPDDDELAELLELLEANVPHPTPSELIFYGPGGREMSAAEVVDTALAYKPIILPKS